MEGSQLNDQDWITCLKEKRSDFGLSQNKLALTAGMSREHLSRIENGKVKLTEEIKEKLTVAIQQLNPDAPLTMLFDYVRIRFPTQDIKHVIEDVLKLNMTYMVHEDFGFYSYTEHYHIGDIFLLTSPDPEKGVLLELKGQGCRQMESYLLAQERSWYDFFMEAFIEGAVMKRLDLAINDHMGILDIPELAQKCKEQECISVFRSFKEYRSGELAHTHEQNKASMGHTLYIGSLKSEIYFCIYEKAYEQYVKLGVPLEEALIKNRFEIRLKNDRAYYAVRDLLTYYDAEQTAFSIIHRYMRFVDKEVNKNRREWKTNDRWNWFMGSGRSPLTLTTNPEPYTLNRTLNWIARQVAPTLKMAKNIDQLNGTTIIDSLIKNATLTEKHRQIVKQQTASISEVVFRKENVIT